MQAPGSPCLYDRPIVTTGTGPDSLRPEAELAHPGGVTAGQPGQRCRVSTSKAKLLICQEERDAAEKEMTREEL